MNNSDGFYFKKQFKINLHFMKLNKKEGFFMTEKEKVKNGLLYNPNKDQELITERNSCKDKCYEYNKIQPTKLKARELKIKDILKEVGKNYLIEQPFFCDYGYNIKIGDNFYANHNLIILDATDIIIGDNVFIGPNCGIYAAGHPIDYITRNKGIEYAKPITIGNNVWIGGNVCILPGVKIGDNVVIGAGSVVNKDIPSNSVAVGSPCIVKKQLK